MSRQAEIVGALHVKPEIEATEEIRRRVQFLKSYCRQASAKGFVLGISGGQDSTLAGRLAQLAAEELRAEGDEAAFYAVRLPYGKQMDEDDVLLALQFIRPDHTFCFQIEEPVNALADAYEAAVGEPLADYHKGNTKARMRMTAQYAIAGQRNVLVIGTDHAAEAVSGFFTKYGDGGADLLPLAGLTKGQGRELLQWLHAPERLYLKTPTADLLDGKPQQADETELGLPYTAIDQYLLGGNVDTATRTAIEQRYAVTRHKRELPATPDDLWWQS